MKLESYKVNRVLEPNFKKSEQVQKGLKKSKIEILWVLWKMQSIGIYLFFEHDSSNGLLPFCKNHISGENAFLQLLLKNP